MVTKRVHMVVAVAGLASPLFAGPAAATDFSNPNAIIIPAPPPPPGCPTLPGPNNSCPSTAARLYPSPITVSGVTGGIVDIQVTLRDLKHDSPSNLDIMVQAPSGKTVMLMDDTCGDEPNTHPIASPITLTFDDNAGQGLPLDTTCTSGTFYAVNDEDDPHELPFTGSDNFPSPAPPQATSIRLSSLFGDDPNGVWKLWVVDDYPTDPGPDRGGFAGGWTLSIFTNAQSTTQTTTAPATVSGGATSSTGAARDPAAATVAQTQSQSQSQTTTTRPAMATTGAQTGRMTEVGAACVALGLVLLTLGYQRTRKIGVFVVHFHH